MIIASVLLLVCNIAYAIEDHTCTSEEVSGLPNSDSAFFIEKYMDRSQSIPDASPILKICLVVATMPWEFGPYQSQMYKLSLELSRQGHDILWFPFSAQVMPTPKGFEDKHLTYVDLKVKDFSKIRISDLNRLSRKHKIDRFIILKDVESIMRDQHSARVPITLWLPLHYTKIVPYIQHILGAFDTVVVLSPTSAAYISDDIAHEYAPHIVEEPKYNETFSKRATHGIPESRYVVLAQGGNYEPYDRKNWGIILQSFAKFYKQNPNAFLYVHALGYWNIFADRMHRVNPQFEKGVRIAELLDQLSIPKSAYILNTNVLASEDAFALKVMADVCLHPSKVEGFGMNVLECQMLGTPVITTKFLAMADFTKYGISVPFRQYELMKDNLVASPDVSSIVTALTNLSSTCDATDSAWKEETKDWIKDHFSSERVGNAFGNILLEQTTKKRQRKKPSDVLEQDFILIKSGPEIHVKEQELSKWILSNMNLNKNGISLGLLDYEGFDQNAFFMGEEMPFAVLTTPHIYWFASHYFENNRTKIHWLVQQKKDEQHTMKAFPRGFVEVKF